MPNQGFRATRSRVRHILAVVGAALATLFGGASPAHAHAFAAIPSDDGSLTVIDVKNASVHTTIPVGTLPVGVAVNSTGTRVYVTNSGDDNVYAINLCTQKVIAIQVGTGPEGIAVSPDDSTLYVVNNTSSNVSVVDTRTNTVVGNPIGVGVLPLGVVFNPAGTRAYVANNGVTNSISVINTSTRAVTDIQIGGVPGAGPAMLALDPSGNPLYASKLAGNVVYVIDTTAGTVGEVVGSIGVGGIHPVGIALDSKGKTLYVANEGSDNVSVIDTASKTIKIIPVGSEPAGIDVDPDDKFVYVTNSNGNSNTVSIIDTSTLSLAGVVTTGFGPEALGHFMGNVPHCP